MALKPLARATSATNRGTRYSGFQENEWKLSRPKCLHAQGLNTAATSGRAVSGPTLCPACELRILELRRYRSAPFRNPDAQTFLQFLFLHRLQDRGNSGLHGYSDRLEQHRALGLGLPYLDV